MAAHRKLAADFGHQADAVVRAARERSQHQEKPVNSFDRVRESLTFSRDKNFEREAVVDERALIRDGLRRGMGEITHAQVRANLDARLASGEFQIVERPQSVPGRQFTTAKTIEAEHEIIRRVREGQNHIEPVLPRPQAIAVADQHPHLNRAQKTVVEDVLSSPDRIQGIQGFAGSGKTTTLTVIRSAAEKQGYQVEGFAPTSRAARQLNEAGIEAGTLQGFLARTANPDLREQKHFYLVDESSLASTNQMREFLSRLGPHDRVLLIGDIRQHQGVEAGRPFEQLQEAGMRTARLDEIVRQQDPALKSAVELLATGQVSAALDALQQQGRVKEIPNAEERIRAIAKSYVESPREHSHRLTGQCFPPRPERRCSPGVEGQRKPCAGRPYFSRPGSASGHDRSRTILGKPLRDQRRSSLRTWQQSHRNRSRRLRIGRRDQPIRKPAHGRESERRACDLRSPPPYRRQRLPRDRTRVLRRRPHPVHCPRQITRRCKSRHGEIEAIHPDGRLSVRLDNNRQIEFNPNEHRHLDHGYAVTSHSSQGLTAERVLVHADSSVHPDLLNSRFAYVSISRASHEATLFTDDMAKLGPQLGADVSKTSALEINQASSVAQGIGLAL